MERMKKKKRHEAKNNVLGYKSSDAFFPQMLYVQKNDEM